MKLGHEHRNTPQGLPDLLLYDTLIDDGVCLLQDGALLAAWKFRGPDMQSATHGEMMALSARLNSILRLGSGWMVQVDAIRSAAPGYPLADISPIQSPGSSTMNGGNNLRLRARISSPSIF